MDLRNRKRKVDDILKKPKKRRKILEMKVVETLISRVTEGADYNRFMGGMVVL